MAGGNVSRQKNQECIVRSNMIFKKKNDLQRFHSSRFINME